MPKRSRRSERAKLQHASGKPGFDSGFVEDAFDKLQDPDFELDLDINDQEDSDEEILVGRFNFSVADEGIKTDSDTDESESETDGLDESGEEDYEDQVVIKSIGGLEEHIKWVSLWIFWQYIIFEVFLGKEEASDHTSSLGNLFWHREVHGCKEK